MEMIYLQKRTQVDVYSNSLVVRLSPFMTHYSWVVYIAALASTWNK